jgi:hypothetical protein
MHRTDADDVELEAPLDALLLNLFGDAVEADIAVREDGLGLVRGSHGEQSGLGAVEKSGSVGETAEEWRLRVVGVNKYRPKLRVTALSRA